MNEPTNQLQQQPTLSPLAPEFLERAVAASRVHVEDQTRALVISSGVAVLFGVVTGSVLLLPKSPRKLKLQLVVIPAFAVSLIWLWIASRDLDRANEYLLMVEDKANGR